MDLLIFRTVEGPQRIDGVVVEGKVAGLFASHSCCIAHIVAIPALLLIDDDGESGGGLDLAAGAFSPLNRIVVIRPATFDK